MSRLYLDVLIRSRLTFWGRSRRGWHFLFGAIRPGRVRTAPSAGRRPKGAPDQLRVAGRAASRGERTGVAHDMPAPSANRLD